MMITHDYSDFNPSGGFSLPPSGRYLLRVVGEEFKTKAPEKGGYAFLTISFQIEEGEQKGQKFTMDYLTGHSNVQTSKIALENLGRIYYTTTGMKPPTRGFDTADLLRGRPFFGVLNVEEKPKQATEQRMPDGTYPSGSFKSANLNGLEPAGAAPTQQQNQPPVQQNAYVANPAYSPNQGNQGGYQQQYNTAPQGAAPGPWDAK